MSEPLPEPNLDTSMSSLADSPAKTSVKPESELDSLEIARGFGLSSPVLLAKFDPDGWLPRTCQGSLLCLEQWELLQGSWPDSAMWDATSVYELQTSEPHTSESEFSSWPTVRASSGGGNTSAYPGAPYRPAIAQLAQNWPTPTRRANRDCPSEADRRSPSLETEALWLTPHGMRGTDHTGKIGGGGEFAKQATQWATPDAPNAGGPRSRQGSIGHGHQVTVAEQAERWQTPATDSFRSRGGDRKNEMGLDQQARFFPTPATRDFRMPNKGSYQERSGTTKGEQLQNFVAHSHPAPAIPDGPTSSSKDPTSRLRLNPRFVEWLMGFPPGWTEL